MADNVIPFEPLPAKGETVTEDRCARQFANTYKNEFLYCHDHGAWFQWDGSIWRRERTPIAFHTMRELVCQLSAGAPNKGKMQSANYIGSAERLARADPVLAMSADQWDQDLFLLGTPDGTVDLRTGELRPASVLDRITKSTAVTPLEADAIEICPTWESFLKQATDNDAGLIRFLQQICGYALTGDISEQMLFFIFGTGGNGKGTFLEVLQGIMADYSVVAPMEALENHKHAQHTTDLAMMRGARLVSASETEEGVAWNEKRIKTLTGGDRITARLMRRDNMTFTPQLTLLVIGNHKPTLKSVDRAIQRRFNMIPFTVIPKTVDKQLGEKLRSEWPSILRWMINGCLDWQQHGFVRPDSVLVETQKYFDEQDTIGEWLRNCCEVDYENEWLTEKSSTLFASWSGFAKANGVEVGNTKTFKPALERLNFPWRRDKDGVWFKCLRIRNDTLV